MPRHEPLSDEMIEIRSVLMRLYHSRQMGEEFYPAAFVNGHAPQMEQNGWIEWCGQGWRLTEAGVQVWARMNPELIAHKYQYGQQLFNEMRGILKGDEAMAGKVCVVEGCGKPRFVTAKGEEHSRCEQHQREKWRDDAEVKRQKKAAAAAEYPIADQSDPKVQAMRQADPMNTYLGNVDKAVKGIEAAAAAEPQLSPVNEGGSESKRGVIVGEVMSIRFDDTGNPIAVVNTSLLPPALETPSIYMTVTDPESLPMDEPVTHDCETCEAKAVIEALRAKSPKLAALIEALEAEKRAARDLGL